MVARSLRPWIAFLFFVLVVPVALAEHKLRVLAWPGYADPDIVKAFEQRTGAKVDVTIVDSDEVMWQKLSKDQAASFDVFAVNTAELQRYLPGGLVVPIDTTALPNTRNQLARFRNLNAISGLVHSGKTYAIPYTYSEMGIIYDRKQVRSAPTSVRALLNPAYKGKVILYNGATHNFSIGAQMLGDSARPFRIEADQWPLVVDQLIALRRNALGFYTRPEESVDLFRRHGAALLFANYGSQQVKLLRAAGLDVGYSIPQEGALAWLDCWAITRGARNPAVALAWINFMLEREAGEVLLSRHGLANTTTDSNYLNLSDRLLWLEPVENAERRDLLWSRIVSGDRASRVLAP